MRAIKVAKAFTLRTDEGETLSFGVGVHPIKDALADHWYVKAHLEDECQPGTAEYVAAARADLKAAEDVAEQAMHAVEQKKADLEAAETLLKEAAEAAAKLKAAQEKPSAPAKADPTKAPANAGDAGAA